MTHKIIKKDLERSYPKVREFMSIDLITFFENQDVDIAIDVLLENSISGAPVLSDDMHLVGMLSEKDCLKVVTDREYHNLLSRGKVGEYMSTHLFTMPDTSDIIDVANAFLSSNFRRFPIVNSDGVLMGIVNRRDILGAIRSNEKKSNWWHQ